MTESNVEPDAEAKSSSESSLTRKEFIRKIVKGAGVTGALIAAPRIVDKFLVPRAFAAVSNSTTKCTATALNDTTAGSGTDSIVGGSTKTIYCGNLGTDASPAIWTSCSPAGGGNGFDATLNCP